MSLELLARARRDEHVLVLALAVALARRVESVAELRAVQARAEQAAGATAAARQLRSIGGSSGQRDGGGNTATDGDVALAAVTSTPRTASRQARGTTGETLRASCKATEPASAPT